MKKLFAKLPFHTLNSWDVVNFYPNCNTEMCINAVKRVVEENPQIDLEVPIECVLEALEITISSQRVSNYITSIEKRKPSCKIEQHFTRPGHTINDYSVLGIVKLENPPRDPTGWLREFEGYWMIKLNTLEPFGLNGINEYERIIKKQGLKIMSDEEISSEF